MNLKSFLVAIVACASIASKADTYSENAELTGDEPIVIAANEEYVFDIDAGATVTVRRVISGAGTLVKSGGGRLILDARNTFSGGITFNAGDIIVKKEGALGTGTVTYSTTVSHFLDFNAPRAVFNNDIVFKASCTGHSNSKPHIRFYSDTTFNGNITGPSSGDVRIGARPNSSSGSAMRAYPVAELNGTMDFSSCTLYISTYSNIKFNGKLIAPKVGMSTEWGGHGHVFINGQGSKFGSGNTSGVNGYAPYINCGAENVLSNMHYVALYRYRDREANCFNLHGFNQTMKAITINPIGNSSYKQPCASQWRAEGMINYNDPSMLTVTSSERPATLTLIGTGANKTNYTFHSFGGGVSLVLDADPGYTLVLSNRTHLMTGTLAVSNGTLRAVNASSFMGLHRLIVSEGATFELETTKDMALASLNDITIDGIFAFRSEAIQSDVSLDTTMAIGANAEVSLPENMVLWVRSLTVNGAPVADGRYVPGGEISQLKSGTIMVRSGGYTLADVWPAPPGIQYILETTGGATNLIDEMNVKVVENGVTNEMPFSALGKLTSGSIRKIGDGVVLSSRSLSLFTGNIFIDEGGFAVDDSLQAGTNTQANAATIWVRDGASFIICFSKTKHNVDRLSLVNHFYLYGNGYKGLGALDLEHIDVIPSIANGVVTLLGDAMISGRPRTRTDQSGSLFLFLGHRLTLKRAAGSSYNMAYYWDTMSKPDSGEIYVDDCQFVPQGTAYWPKTCDSCVILTNSSTFSFYNSSMWLSDDTEVVFSSGGVNYWGCGGSEDANSVIAPGNIKQGWWDGPVRVDGTASLYGTKLKKGLPLCGKVSGGGKIRMSSGWLLLSNPSNDFTGSISVIPTTTTSYKSYEMGLGVYRDCALPFSCSEIAITNGHFAVVDAVSVNLPAVSYHTTTGTNVNFYSNGALVGGTLAGLRKTGPGTLTYTVPLSVTGVLDVAEGTLASGGTELSAGMLAVGGGTISGSVRAEGLKLTPSAVVSGESNAEYKVLSISGSLEFGDDAKLDLDEILDMAAADRPRLSTQMPVLRAEGGITGLPRAVDGTLTRQKHLAAVVNGSTLYIVRISGMVVSFR